MNCEKAKEMILSNAPGEDRTLMNHMAACEECQCLSAEWNTLKGIKPQSVEPSAMIDSNIIGAATSSISRKKHRNRTIAMRIVIYASAACFVLIAWFAFSPLQNKMSGDKYSNTWKGFDTERSLLVFMTELEVGIHNINEELFQDDSEPELDISMPDFSYFDWRSKCFRKHLLQT
jgi:hypothetical protein